MTGVFTWTPGPPREVSAGRRLLEVLAFVAVWIGIGELITGGTGWSLPGDAKYVSNADIQWYLVIGIPLVAGFQLFVRRRPLRDLWVRDGQPVVNRVALQALVVAIAIYPLFSLIKTFTDPPSGEAAAAFYFAAATCAAAAAAWAFMHFDRQTWKCAAGRLGPVHRPGALPGRDGRLPLDLVAEVRQPRGERHHARLRGRGPQRDQRHAVNS
jgi:hypothetical protein